MISSRESGKNLVNRKELAVKFNKIVLTCAALLNSSALFAAQPAIECSNGNGVAVKLVFDEDAATGTLTYGQEGETEVIEGLETSFTNGVGAAMKGSEVLFVVTPAFPTKIGELVVEGKTYLLQCK
jgi:hypothetical protein